MFIFQGTLLIRKKITRHDKRKRLLDELYEAFDATYIPSDPIQMVHRFERSGDQEIMAVLASALAFGQVAQINKTISAMLALMNNQPHSYVTRLDPEHELLRWRAWYYRMIRPQDILRLMHALKIILQKHASLGSWVESHYRNEDTHLGITWGRCVDDIKNVDEKYWHWPRARGVGFRFLLADPTKKSACKRAFLLLRWMVRKDDIDLGLWQLPSSKLLIPVDTHIQRISQYIGLTTRRDTSQKTAIEITEALKKLDPNDPVKYDFAICRLGILKMCPRKRNPIQCKACPIYDICLL